MRSLIRPTLFIAARVGFVLSVGAWAVADRSAVRCESPVGSFGLCRPGWVVFIYREWSPYWRVHKDALTGVRLGKWFPGETNWTWRGPFDLAFHGLCVVRPPVSWSLSPTGSSSPFSPCSTAC